MKIGILTHHYINNFGAFLQAYALQQATKKLRPGDEVYIIDDVNLRHFIINTGGWFRFYRNRENFSNWSEKIRLPITFSKARYKYMLLSNRCYKTKDVDKLKLDCIIVGSDEVWNYKEAKGNAKIKFGHGLNCSKLIAYAPSVGSTAESDIPDYVTEGIKRFTAVSARDDLTEKLAKRIRNEKICRVVDPTFLTEIPDEQVTIVKKPYILFYYCDGLSDNEKNKIFNYAKENGYSVYGAGENDKNYSATTVNLTPFQWVWMFRNASYIITGTFHGAVFSMLNQRQFVCFLTNSSRIQKVGSLLSEFGLMDRQTNGNASEIIKVLEEKIDYSQVDTLIEERRKESLDFLESAIHR